MASPVSRRALAGLVKARLQAAATLTVYVGEVDPPPPTIPNSTRVKPYAVLFSGDGTPIDEQPLTADNTGTLIWTFTVTAAAGYHDDALAAIDTIHGQLDGWTPVLAGYQFNPVGTPPGFDAGAVRRDTTVEPARFFLPLGFVLVCHRFA